MYLTVENYGLGVLEVIYRDVKDKQADLKLKAEQDAEKNIRAMELLAEKIARENQIAYEIKQSQQEAWASMFRNFYGVPWEQVAVLGGVFAAAAYILWRD